jgi:hypothetical protein
LVGKLLQVKAFLGAPASLQGKEFDFKVFLRDLRGLSEYSERAREMMVFKKLSRTKPQRHQEYYKNLNPVFNFNF